MSRVTFILPGNKIALSIIQILVPFAFRPGMRMALVVPVAAWIASWILSVSVPSKEFGLISPKKRERSGFVEIPLQAKIKIAKQPMEKRMKLLVGLYTVFRI